MLRNDGGQRMVLHRLSIRAPSVLRFSPSAPSNIQFYHRFGYFEKKSGCLTGDRMESWQVDSSCPWRRTCTFASFSPNTRVHTSGGPHDDKTDLIDCQKVSVVDFVEYVSGESFWSMAEDAKISFKHAYINFSHWVMVDELTSPNDAGPSYPR
jgi:hypothetical protein